MSIFVRFFANIMNTFPNSRFNKETIFGNWLVSLWTIQVITITWFGSSFVGVMSTLFCQQSRSQINLYNRIPDLRIDANSIDHSGCEWYPIFVERNIVFMCFFFLLNVYRNWRQRNDKMTSGFVLKSRMFSIKSRMFSYRILSAVFKIKSQIECENENIHGILVLRWCELECNLFQIGWNALKG
jgi:hypothetical protein